VRIGPDTTGEEVKLTTDDSKHELDELRAKSAT
jgi:hypothetical protein